MIAELLGFLFSLLLEVALAPVSELLLSALFVLPWILIRCFFCPAPYWPEVSARWRKFLDAHLSQDDCR